MKTKLKILHPVAAAMFLLAGAGLTTASAQTTVVDFTDYTGGESTFDLVASSAPLDLTTPGAEASDFATAPDSATVYAGADDRVFVTDGFDKVDVNGVPIALMWKKEDFLNGGASQAVSLDDTSEFTLTTLERGGGGTKITNGTLQWLVYEGGNVYISDDTIDIGDNATGTWNSGDFSTMEWATIDLTTSITASAGTFDALDVSDIDGLGFYVDADGERMSFQDFTATATVIPEPTTFALFAGALGLALVTLRRRRS